MSSGEKEGTRILLVDTNSGLSRGHARRLRESQRVECVRPEALRDAARFIDFAPIVVYLEGSSGEAQLEKLEPVRSLPAGNALILIVSNVANELLEAAISRLEPRHVLVHPVPDPVLDFTIRSSKPLPSGHALQRPARALLGVSSAIRDVLAKVAQVAPSRANVLVLGDDFLDAISQCDFPGNVRELRNTLERAIALATPGEPISIEDLASDTSARPVFLAMGTLRDRVAQVELQAIREALEQCDGNRTRAATQLGLSRPGLRQKMRRLGLE